LKERGLAYHKTRGIEDSSERREKGKLHNGVLQSEAFWECSPEVNGIAVWLGLFPFSSDKGEISPSILQVDEKKEGEKKGRRPEKGTKKKRRKKEKLRPGVR